MRSLARLIRPAGLSRSRRTGVGLVAAGFLVVVSASTAVLASSRDTAGTSPLVVRSAPVGGALAALGDQVWLDADHDGLQDAGEGGVNGLTVTLLDGTGNPVSTDGNGDPITPATTQPADGRDGTYRFAHLAPGAYAVEVSGLPAGHRFTVQGSDPDDGTDSNADPTTGRTPVVELAAGEDDDTVDAGIWDPAPALVVETRAQGSDADDPPGPSVPVGDPVALDHLVTNTGNEPLEDLAVTDDQGVGVSCPQTTLGVLETVACEASTPALSGVHTHVGTAQAEGQESGEIASASDPATYTGVLAGLDVEKTVDGADADTAADAIDVVVGATVTFAYTVTNTGSAELTGVSVVDDVLGPVTCPQAELGPGESMACTDVPATAASGLNTNVATGTASATTGGDPVGDTDPATYRGVDARIGLLKEVLDPGTGQYLDADADAGSPGTSDGVPAVLLAGADARYRLHVANQGNLALTDVVVGDDRCDAAPQVVAGDGAPTGVLGVGETWVLACTRSDVTDDLTNTATVTATSTAGPPAGNGASERATVVVAGEADVQLDKQVALPGGGYGDAATLPSGSTATFRIEVTNTGQAPLIDLVVSDAQAPGCDRTLPGPLAVGASEAWTCTLGPVTSSLTNTASALAQPRTGADPVTATDQASIDVVTPAAPDLTLAKVVDATDAAARTATFRLTVHNAGPGPAPGPIHVVDTLPSGLGFRSASGAGWTCGASGQAVTCSHGAALAEGASSSVWLEVDVADDLGQVTNRASVSGVADSNPDNDDASAVLALDTSPPGGGGGGGGGSGGPGGTGGAAGGQGDGHGPLAMTGAETLGLLLLGISLVGIGSVVLVASRRRRGEAGQHHPDGLVPPTR